jgi:PKD repeat protein
MSMNRTVRLGILRIAVVLAVLVSLACLVVPKEVIDKADIVGIGKGLGVGKAEAADVTPGTVDNSTSDMAVMTPSQRKLFYAAGRFWIFYTDGSDLVYKSSSDGLSWSARSASLGASSSGQGTSIYFDGTYAHYARVTNTNNQALYYRRGVPNADGTITWSADEQIAVAAVNGVRYLHPNVSADSSGHALISYHYEKQNGHAGEGPYVTRSGNTDGTWGSAPAGFPYELISDSESEWYTTVHALTSNKIAVTFADYTDIKTINVGTYDGANWNSTQNTESSAQSGSGYSVVAEGDDVHIVLLKESTYEIRYCKYTYSTNTVGPESTVQSPTTSLSFPALAKTSENDLYCFWARSPGTDHVYYRRMVSGVWEADYTDWLTETSLTTNGGVSTFYDQSGSDYIGLAWETGSASPYDVRFAAVSTAFPPNQPANIYPSDRATGLSLTPTLQSSAFFDRDGGDTHGASQWQITGVSGDYASPVFDSAADSLNLVSVLVPPSRLAYSTTYYWHVRYQDSHGDWSAWSSETSFTTAPPPLTAQFSADITVLTVGQSAQFTDSSTGEATSWNWDFGDGSTTTWTVRPHDGKISHVYATEGNYTVSLTIASASGNDVKSRPSYITVCSSPQADFSASATRVLPGEAITFAALSGGGVPPLTYAWEFEGDGVVDSTDPNPTHTYAAAGIYTVSLKLTDSRGNSDTETKTGYIVVGNAIAPDGVSPQGGTIQTADGQIATTFPADAVTGDTTVVIEQVSPSAVAKAPSGFKMGHTCFTIEAADASGKAISAFSRLVTITVKYSEEDMAAARGDPANLVLAYFNEATGKWDILDTTLNRTDQSLSVTTTHFSTWAILARSPSGGLPPWTGMVIGFAAVLAAGMATYLVVKLPAVAPKKPTSRI